MSIWFFDSEWIVMSSIESENLSLFLTVFSFLEKGEIRY